MKFTDLSIHFTPKGQDVDVLFDKIESWLKSESGELYTKSDAVLHHCFMRKSDVTARGFDTKICDKLESLMDDSICWNGVSQLNIEKDRSLMLQNISKVNGVAVFVGNIIDGVAEELHLAKDLGCNIIIIE